MFVLVFLLLFLLGVLYTYFANAMVLFLAERNSNAEKLAALERDFQELESAYIGLSGKMDISYAESLGFVKAEPEAFVYRGKAVAQNNMYGTLVR